MHFIIFWKNVSILIKNDFTIFFRMLSGSFKDFYFIFFNLLKRNIRTEMNFLRILKLFAPVISDACNICNTINYFSYKILIIMLSLWAILIKQIILLYIKSSGVMWVLCISGSYSHEKGSIIPQIITEFCCECTLLICIYMLDYCHIMTSTTATRWICVIMCSESRSCWGNNFKLSL